MVSTIIYRAVGGGTFFVTLLYLGKLFYLKSNARDRVILAMAFGLVAGIAALWVYLPPSLQGVWCMIGSYVVTRITEALAHILS